MGGPAKQAPHGDGAVSEGTVDEDSIRMEEPMKFSEVHGEQAARKRAERLFAEAKANGRFVITVSIIKDDGNVHHETVRLQSFPVGNLDASLSHVEAAYYGMGMRRNEDAVRLPEREAEAGGVPVPEIRPLPPADRQAGHALLQELQQPAGDHRS
jgi:hypothetical protein